MKNIRNILIVLSAVFFSVSIFPMRMTEMGKVKAKKFFEEQELIKKSVQKRGSMLIFLDDSEKMEDKLGAIGGDLVIALYQQAGPIIVSTSLLYALRELREKDTRSYEIILNEAVESIQGTMPYLFKNQLIALSKICFQQDQWIMKKINNSLNLLIPKSYLEPFGIATDKVQHHSETVDVTEVELELGLRVNHMEFITIERLDKPNDESFADYFINSLDIIFCNKFEYKDKKITIPEWCIYINGHGLINHSIAHLSLDGFKKFLQFLDSKIVTKLLVVLSCYALGVNANKIYGEMRLGTQQYYSFPIIAQGINDAPALAPIPDIDMNIW